MHIDNPQAFPLESNHYLNNIKYPSMTLLDYFAGQVLTGLSSIPDNRRQYYQETNEEFIERIRSDDANYCYEVANAMLKARKRIK